MICAAEITGALNGDVVIAGSIAQLGNTYILVLRVIDPRVRLRRIIDADPGLLLAVARSLGRCKIPGPAGPRLLGHATAHPVRRGIAPALLLEQTRSTAPWALEGPDALQSTARTRLLGAAELEQRWREPDALLDYLGVMLAAHYTTVATFVPTDVDTHIRHHIWQEIDHAALLERALAVVDEAAAWEVSPVSARVVELDGFTSPVGLGARIFGHAGEWFSVRAGALGRALKLGAQSAIDALVEHIERELTHEAACFAFARERDPLLALRVATTIAHNTGDLSRVIEAWPGGTPRKQELSERFARLGHPSTNPHPLGDVKRELELAGHVNKAVMAPENHRYLALREPRVLRTSRAFLLPLGPFHEDWARMLCEARLEVRDFAEVVSALLYGTETTPGSTSFLRALAEIERNRSGGLNALAGELRGARRKLLQKPVVRNALRIGPDQWNARLIKSYHAALSSAR